MVHWVVPPQTPSLILLRSLRRRRMSVACVGRTSRLLGAAGGEKFRKWRAKTLEAVVVALKHPKRLFASRWIPDDDVAL